MDVDRPRGGARKQKARGLLADARATCGPGRELRLFQGRLCRRHGARQWRRRDPRLRRVSRKQPAYSLADAWLCAAVQGRGFREPMELEDRLQGGQFEALPSDKAGPGPAKCELAAGAGDRLAGTSAAVVPLSQPGLACRPAECKRVLLTCCCSRGGLGGAGDWGARGGARGGRARRLCRCVCMGWS